MNWTMTKACDNCPFRKEGGIPLHKSRIKEISGMMLDSQGGTFPCHKTTSGEEYEDRDRINDKEVHCAGALAYALKQRRLPQLARIMERFGDLDGDRVLEASGELVWDSERQWLASSHAVMDRKRKTSRSTP